MDVSQLIIIAGIPTAATGFFVWLLQRRITKQDRIRQQEEENRERRAEQREKKREELDIVLLQSTTAALALAEATARAVQRIPDAHCNGDMHRALDCATETKNKQKNFLTELGIHSLHEE